jgi:hypothetical protein
MRIRILTKKYLPYNFNVSFRTARGKYIDYVPVPVPVPESDPSGLTMLYWTAAALFPVCLATFENLQKKSSSDCFYQAKITGDSKKIADLILSG